MSKNTTSSSWSSSGDHSVEGDLDYRFQIVKCDNYQSVPTSLDKQHFTIGGVYVPDPAIPEKDRQVQKLAQVPVIRIYSKTTSGHSSLLHVHNVFPYLYIPYKGPLDSEAKINSSLWGLKVELDRVLKQSFQRNKDEEETVQASDLRQVRKRRKVTKSEKQKGSDDDEEDDGLPEEFHDNSNHHENSFISRFIADLSLIKSIPFYGFHGVYQPFIKISILNPRYASRLTRLLHDGKIFGKFIQPYEAHIPYHLQFLCDYNLFCSDFLKVNKVYWRFPIIQLKDEDIGAHFKDYFPSNLTGFNSWKFENDVGLRNFLKNRKIDERTVVLDDVDYPRMSRCLFEIDVTSNDILNRYELKERKIHHGFNEYIDNVNGVEPLNEKYINSTREILKDVSFQLKLKNLKANPDWRLFDNLNVRTFIDTDWVENEQHLNMLKYCSEKSWKEYARLHKFRADQVEPKISDLDSLSKYPKLLDNKPTSFQAIGQLQYIVNIDDVGLLTDLQNRLDNTKDYSLYDLISRSAEIITNTQMARAQTQRPVNLSHSIIYEDEDDDNESDLPEGNDVGAEHQESPVDDRLVDEDGTAENTDDDLDDFLGSIPHLNENDDVDPDTDAEKDEDEGKQGNVDDYGDRDLFGGLPSDHSPDMSIVHEEHNDLEEDIDRKFLQMTQGAPGTKSLAGSSMVNVTIGEITQELLEGSFGPDSSINNPVPVNPELSQPQNMSNITRSNNGSFIFGTLEDSNSKEKLYELECEPVSFDSHKTFLDDLELNHGGLRNEYPDPFYSNLADSGTPFYYAGKKFNLKSTDIKAIDNYQLNKSLSCYCSSEIYKKFNETYIPMPESVWSYQVTPPSFDSVHQWCLSNPIDKSTISDTQKYKSQIKPVTQNAKGYKYASYEAPVSRKKSAYMRFSMLMVEIHVNTRGELYADPMFDEVVSIFWRFYGDDCEVEQLGISDTGILVVDKTTEHSHRQSKWEQISQGCPIEVFGNEIDMIKELISLVEFLDPDILAGYEIHSSSWGYILERFSKYHLLDLNKRLSRSCVTHSNKSYDRWGYTHASSVKIGGRHMLNMWRHLRGDMALQNYTLENVAFHSLHIRIPRFSHTKLTKWFTSGRPSLQSIVMSYYVQRLNTELEILVKQEVIPRTTEQSRLLGIDFYAILDRGSQYKVESLMVRMTKAENFILISPSKKQVFKQDALQCIPLILEPETSYYKSPLVVLDFQSLYPSILIAYNYCYSTMLGRLQGYDSKTFQKIGVTNLKLVPGLLKFFEDNITISPNGIMFMKEKVRKSLLAKFLTEILDARILVKGSMRLLNDDKELMKLYHNKQLALKLIANVTYGYTSATFSGRMPCSAIADSIVASARETLMKALNTIETNPKWGAKVVYGDTDSLFVYLPGKSKEEAFVIGKEMANCVTSLNPSPVKLKFEKVYFPSVLLAKKRYVGYSYEYEDQKVPKFDAKGIETVRRDGIPAQQKIVEKSLRILFETNDISKVKEYVVDQFYKIMSDEVNIQDFCFSKEVRLGSYKDDRYAPPGAQISMAKVLNDHRAQPQYRERVSYLVIQGAPNQILRERCITPDDFVKRQIQDDLHLDWKYYITKVLSPPLERVFNIMGVDVKAWYRNMHHIDIKSKSTYSHLNTDNNIVNQKKKRNGLVTIYQVIRIANCIKCGGKIKANTTTPLNNNNNNSRGYDTKLCATCLNNERDTIVSVLSRLRQSDKKVSDLMMVCNACTRNNLREITVTVPSETADNCISHDCPIYYSKIRAMRTLMSDERKYRDILEW